MNHARALEAQPSTPAGHGIGFGEAVRVWAKIAALSFGGPAGQIAVMHRILVEEKRWIGEERFLHALNYCMLLPGPEAQQLAVYIGWLLHRTLGGLVAGHPVRAARLRRDHGAVAGCTPGSATCRVVEALFFGLKAAVLAIVLEAVVRIGRRALRNRVMVALAAAAFVAIFFFDVPFPLIILGAGVIGLLGARAGLAAFLPAAAIAAIGGTTAHRCRIGARRGDARARAADARVVARRRADLPAAVARPGR